MPAKTAQAGLIHERLHSYAAAFLCAFHFHRYASKSGLALTTDAGYAVLVDEIGTG
jgi:hypothetical protein